MLVALSAIALDQTAPTKADLAKADHFLGYAASQEEVVLAYHPGNRVLVIHSDVSYLSEATSYSRAGGHFYCSTHTEY